MVLKTSYIWNKIIYWIEFLKFAFFGIYIILVELEILESIRNLISKLLSRLLSSNQGENTYKEPLEKLREEFKCLIFEGKSSHHQTSQQNQGNNQRYEKYDNHDNMNHHIDGEGDKHICNHHQNNGRYIIVTGANSGIGFETTKFLVQNGCNVIMVCRSLERGDEALKKIKSCLPLTASNKVILKQCDVSSIQSVDQFMKYIEKEYQNTCNSNYDGAPKFEVSAVIMNAGIMACPYYTSTDGYELHLATNFLGHALMTIRFISLFSHLIKKSDGPEANQGIHPCRFIMVSSEAHRYISSFPPQNENILKPSFLQESNYNRFIAYSYSKACQILFSISINNYLKFRYPSWKDIVMNSAHPGVVDTNIVSHLWYPIQLIFKLFAPLCCKKPEQGSFSSLVLALSKQYEENGGKYLNSFGHETSTTSFTLKQTNQFRLLKQVCDDLKDYISNEEMEHLCHFMSTQQ